MASISKKGARNHHTYTLTLTEASTSIERNESIVNYSFDLIDDANWFWSGWGNNITFSVSANGAEIASGSIPNHTTKNQNLASGSFTVPHNADGTKTISYSFTVTDKAYQSYTSGDASESGTMVLSTIPRYANFTKHELSNVTENSVTVNWDADAWCDAVAYALNDGEWVTTMGLTFTIGNLNANTGYNLKVFIRRKDSQLWTASNYLYFTTYNYPHCTNSPNFTIGDALTLDIYNPLGRSINVAGYAKTDGREIFKGSLSGTSITGFNDENSVNLQYASIPNYQNGQYKVVVSYGSVAMTRDEGNTYKVRGNEIPTINAFDYIDNNANTVAITGNDQHIVQNKSILLARFHSATPNYGAGSIAQYHLECNGKTAIVGKEGAYDLGTIDSERDVELKLTAVDSRGLSASKTIKVIMVAHSDPTAIVTLQRLNNYENETYLTVDASVSRADGNNTMDIKYRYKLLGGEYNDFEPIEDRKTKTFPNELDKRNVYVFNIVVTDAFGATYDEEHTLDKGVFPLFIDTVRNSVGINCFPTEDLSLEVNGFNLFNVYRACKNIYLANGGGLKITVDSIKVGDKIPLVIVGADNMNMIPVITLIHWRTNGDIGLKHLGAEVDVTGDKNTIHINGSQYSFYSVYAPLGVEIDLENGAM